MRMKALAALSALALSTSALASSRPASQPAIPERGDDGQRASKNGRLDGEVGGVGITVTYGRPKVRDRKVWGNLVPMGKVWRSGADEATTITFDRAAKVQGQKIARGTYALFTVPGPDGWEVIFNAQPKQWGAYKHDPAKDVLRVKTQAKTHGHTEELTFAIEDGHLVLLWEKLAVPVRIEKAG